MPAAPVKLKVDEVMSQLEALGDEQNRKTYARHGASGPLFGVSFANLYAIQKRIKIDHDLALALWKTGNSDARVLATLIADPAQAVQTVEAWMPDISSYGLSLMVGSYVSKSLHAQVLGERWKDEDDEWLGDVAWIALGSLALATNDIPDAYFEDLIAQVESEIHGRKNRVRYSMVGFLIAAGGRNETLRDRALAAAKLVGPVHVDHGETSCKTPDPLVAIEKTYAHRHRARK